MGLNMAPDDTPLKSINQYPLRVLLYSHDSVGLGHLRRNLAIASEITAKFENASVMIVTGSSCATQFDLPRNTDLIKIPTISKNDTGDYVTDSFGGSLQVTLTFRSKMILEAFRSFEPHLVIVDHQLTGLKGEAMAMLREAKNKETLLFFGMRDIKDGAEAVRRAWDNTDCRWALNECYDQVCVYGMQEVFDPREVYAPLLDAVKRCDFTGFIVRPEKQVATKQAPRARKKVLVIFGGGGDGAQRAEQYLQALANAPAHWDSHIVTGPMMDTGVIRSLTDKAHKIQPLGSVTIKRFHRNIPRLLSKVDAVVSMAGYNSCAEILQSGVPAVLMPRSFPREEQLIRAMRMAQLGWVSAMPQTNPDPEYIFDAVERALDSSRTGTLQADLNGLNSLSRIILDHLQLTGQCEAGPQVERAIGCFG